MSDTRIIKFRGKPTKNNTSYFEDWVYGSLVISDDKYYILLDVLDNIKRDDYEVYMIEVIPETVGQFIVLKDYNDTEIYVGDVVYVEEDDLIGLVDFEIGTSKYIIAPNPDYPDKIADFEYYYGKHLKIIGNIFDNKDEFNYLLD